MRWNTRNNRGRTGTSEETTSGGTLQRRGALAGVAVVMAGLLARVNELPARAADGDPLLLGRDNQADSRTELDRAPFPSTSDTAFVVTNTNGPAIQGSGGGNSATSPGVLGQGDGVGVFGQTVSLGGIAGVLGNGRDSGVTGTSTSGIGVSGLGSTGVSGFTNAGGGNGVFGQGAAGGAGVFGRAAVSANPNTYGVFSSGRLGASGPITALIEGTDGPQRVTFSITSPDGWIVDVGSATLRRGRATVPLAPDFASVIDTSNYQVFVTPYGPTRALFVPQRTPTGFEVRGSRDGDHDGDRDEISFAYQVIGRRRDISVSRPTVAPADAQPRAPKRPRMPEVPDVERPYRRGRDT